MPLTLNWQHIDTNNQYLRLNDVILDTSYFAFLRGVYIIWYQDGSHAIVVYAGQAKQDLIRDRLYARRNDLQIRKRASAGTLYVAVAAAATDDIDGIERFLHDSLNPLVRDRTPNTDPISVNLPRELRGSIQIAS